jgi:hypothetical protein
MRDQDQMDLESQVDSKDPNELTPLYVRQQYDRGTLSLRTQQYNYTRNMAFFEGMQWLQYNTALNRWSTVPKDPERVQVTFNILKPRLMRAIAKLMSRELVFEVLPADGDSSSVRGAQISEAVVEDLHCYHNWEDARADAYTATYLGGTSILAVDWNAKAGDTIDYLPITGESFGTGEIEESVLSIAEVAWEPGTKRAEKGFWWARAQALPPKLVQQTYNLPEEPAADVAGMTSPLSTLISQSSNNSDPGQAQTLVITYYERPNPLRPKGAIATVVGGKFVAPPVDWYFPFTETLNMRAVRMIRIPGVAAGDTVFSDACKVQKSYNDTWSAYLEWQKNMSGAPLLVPEGTIDTIDDLSDLPGGVLPYASVNGEEPHYMQMPVMPQWMLELRKELRDEIDDMLSEHDVSRGDAPTNADSGVAYSILAEQDSTVIGDMTKAMARAFEDLASMALQIYSVKVKETRKAKINRGSNPEAVEWTGEALSGQFDVEIPIDSIMPRSHAADYAMAKDLYVNGIIKDPMQFLRSARQPGYKGLLGTIDPDANKAEREEHLMSIGNVCIPADFDDHRKHITSHNNFRKTTRYESLPPQIQQIVIEHIQAHEMLAAEQMGQQQAKLAVSPGLAAIPTASAQEPILGHDFAQAQLGVPPQAPAIPMAPPVAAPSPQGQQSGLPEGVS